MLDPHTFSSYHRFIYTYCHVYNSGFGTKVQGGYTGKIQRMLENYALGRKYRQVHMYLPRLIENIITVPCPPELRKRYDGLKYLYTDILEERDEKKFYSAFIAVLQKLRQITMCEEKLDAITQLVEDVGISNDIVIFCWYKEAARKIASKLSQNTVPHVREAIIPVITGDVSPTDRARLAKDSHIVVATLSSLSEGVDLSHAKHIIFSECFYTHGKMAQALARVRRWTENQGSIHAYYVHMHNTVDEIIYEVQKSRGINTREILKQILE
jgi:superfamily II DNA or RNA helicase